MMMSASADNDEVGQIIRSVVRTGHAHMSSTARIESTAA